MTDLRRDVTQAMVAVLLQERRPPTLEVEQFAKFSSRVDGAAVEVVLLTGYTPPEGPIRALAVEAIACQTASEIEYAEYPEQQSTGDVGRGWHLHQRYLELLARLREVIEGHGGVIPDDGGEQPVPATTVPRPQGNFPPPRAWPDPIEYERRHGWNV